MITTCQYCGGLRADPGEMFGGRPCQCSFRTSKFICANNHPEILSTGDKCLLCAERKMHDQRVDDLIDRLYFLETEKNGAEDKLERHNERHSTRRTM